LDALSEPIAEQPDTTADDARKLAGKLLRGIGSRLGHSCGVVVQVRRGERLLEPPWASALLCGAWLHDVGNARHVARTGFHQLDGARWRAARGWPMDVCRLVAWHTGADTEARLRGREAELVAEFDPPPAMARAVLTWADLTTSPVGAPVTVERRLAGILQRHPPGSIAHQATVAARPGLLKAVQIVEALLADRGPA
jgi:hypothetical protein